MGRRPSAVHPAEAGQRLLSSEKADEICSSRAFLLMTQCGHPAMQAVVRLTSHNHPKSGSCPNIAVAVAVVVIVTRGEAVLDVAAEGVLEVLLAPNSGSAKYR